MSLCKDGRSRADHKVESNGAQGVPEHDLQAAMPQRDDDKNSSTARVRYPAGSMMTSRSDIPVVFHLPHKYSACRTSPQIDVSPMGGPRAGQGTDENHLGRPIRRCFREGAFITCVPTAQIIHPRYPGCRMYLQQQQQPSARLSRAVAVMLPS